MSIFVPKSYKIGIIYFVTDSNIAPEVAERISYQQNVLLIIVNVRNGVLGYLHKGIIKKQF